MYVRDALVTAVIPEPASDAGSFAERYQVLGELGRGGMGVVWLVLDRLRGEQFALKRMQRASAEQVRRIKREFRSIEAVVHPNVITVVELGVDGDVPYFLMEVVHGTDLYRACRPEPLGAGGSHAAAAPHPSRTETLVSVTANSPRAAHDLSAARSALDDAGLERLWDALPQLLSALEHLHACGLVHRDLKPANVLIRDDGVLKLLDFGILGAVGDSADGAPEGSAAYVSPAQARGEPPTAHDDLYSLGVLLFEAISGHVPFDGPTARDVVQQHLHAQPPSLKLLAPACPAWLADAVHALLAKDGQARPSIAALRELGRRHLPKPAWGVAPTVSTQLLERNDVQARLSELLAGSGAAPFRCVALEGATGLGESALFEWARGAARRQPIVWLGSCVRQSERVPFNAIDGLVDELSRVIELHPELTADARGRFVREMASSAFAVLRAPTPPRAALDVDPKVALDALTELLARVAERLGSVWLACDDLQWADEDSVRWLRRLIGAAPAGVTLLMGVRDDLHSAAFSTLWAEPWPRERLTLQPLSAGALGAIIEAVSRDAGRPRDEADLAQIVDHCAGRPLLAMAFARMALREAPALHQPPVRALLEAHLDASPELRRPLGLLAVADGVASATDLANHGQVSWGAMDTALLPLVRERLVASAGTRGEARGYDFSHDLIRRELLLMLTADELRAAHAARARQLRARGAQASLQVRHLLGAGEFGEAGRLAETGAREAEASNAFGLAAELYAIAIEHGAGQADALHETRALALECCGRYLDAAEAWQHVAELRVDEARVGALLHKAKAQLATEHIVEGRHTLEQARRERQKRSLLSERATHMLYGLRFSLGPWAAPGPRKVQGHHRPRPTDDRDAFLGTVLAYFAPFAGVRQVLYERGAYRRAGNRVQSAEIDYVLAYLALWGSRRRGATALGERYMQSARQLLGGVPGPEQGRPYALDLNLQGAIELHHARWDAARQKIDTTLDWYERAGRRGCFEHMFAWTQRMFTDWFGQDLPALTRTLDTMETLARDVQDPALRCDLGFARMRWALLRGDLDAAERYGEEFRSRWPQDGTSNQCYVGDLFSLTPQIYTTDGVAGFHRLSELRERYKRFMPSRGMYGGNSLSHYAMFELAGLRAGAAGASRAQIERWARDAFEACPMNSYQAVRAAAYASDDAGEPERALRILHSAQRGAADVGQPIDVAVAEYQRGLRLGGDEGHALRTQAEARITAAGAHPMLLHEDAARR